MTGSRPLRVLDFDIETRPLSYWTKDRPTAEMTVIAWCWVDDPKSIKVVKLEPPPNHDTSKQAMLAQFLDAYNAADMVTGHYITRFDLPAINGECMEHGFPNLEPKLAQDTRTQLIKKGDIPATQEALYEMLCGSNEKYAMTQGMWRAANRLTTRGVAESTTRAYRDVKQHMELRREMLKRGLLKPPKVWRP